MGNTVEPKQDQLSENSSDFKIELKNEEESKHSSHRPKDSEPVQKKIKLDLSNHDLSSSKKPISESLEKRVDPLPESNLDQETGRNETICDVKERSKETNVMKNQKEGRGKYFILRGGFLPGELSQSAWYIELL